MNTVREYRMPLIIGAGALVAILLLWSILVAPQNSKLSSLRAQETQLQTQETSLQAKLASLQAEGKQLSSNCADLQKITTQIPSVQTPTDVDAEESSFESQFNALAASSGVALTQFSGFAPAGTPTSAAPTTPGAAAPSAAVTPVPTNLAVTGTYGQVSAFVNGLDSFPRLFVIQHFDLAFGTAASSTSSAASSTASAAASGGAPLWVGGTKTAGSAGPYSLALSGSIYYTSTPNALEACTKATAATASFKKP